MTGRFIRIGLNGRTPIEVQGTLRDADSLLRNSEFPWFTQRSGAPIIVNRAQIMYIAELEDKS